VNVYATLLKAGSVGAFSVGENRQAYMVLMEGDAEVNGVTLHERDALEIVEEDIQIHAGRDAHILILEMRKTDL